MLHKTFKLPHNQRLVFLLLLFIVIIRDLEDLSSCGLTLSDIPRFTMQREHIMISEHHASERRTAHQLEVTTKKLGREKELSNALLGTMLPSKVVEELRKGNPVLPEQFDNVSIFFSDIVGFTSISSSVEPIKVVDLLNRLYTVMDNITDALGLYKVETIGDAYMVRQIKKFQ